MPEKMRKKYQKEKPKMNEKIIWKKSVRRALICGLICAVLISGCEKGLDMRAYLRCINIRMRQ